MQPFTRFASRERTEPPQTNRPDPSVIPGPFNRTFMPTQSGAFLSRGVSIKGSVKFLNELLIDGEVEGTVDSTGTLTIGEHACIRGEIRTKSVKVGGTVEGNIFATERCELQASCTLRGDIEAPRLVVNENATLLGSVNIILTLFWIDLRSVFNVLQKRQPIFFWYVCRRDSLKWMIVSRRMN